MKNIFVLLLLLSSLVTFAAIEKESGNSNSDVTDSKGVDGTDPKNSIIRLQNKVIAGIETSVNPGWTADDDFMIRTLANFRIGYRFKQHVLTGSLGVEFTEEMFMPITIDYKYYLKYQNVWSPYFYGQAGYSWHLKGNINSRYSTSNYKQIDPGALASVGFGYSVTTSLNEFYFALGYSFRDYVEVTVISSNGAKQHLDKSMNGLAFSVGFNF
jgi:hypothetical protein